MVKVHVIQTFNEFVTLNINDISFRAGSLPSILPRRRNLPSRPSECAPPRQLPSVYERLNFIKYPLQDVIMP